MKYSYQNENWPSFTWDATALQSLIGMVRNKQGKLMGKMEAMGFALQEQALLDTLTVDVLKSSKIEGEILNTDQVRSSIARRLGMDIAGLIPSDSTVDGVVDMMLDATQNFAKPLVKDRLFGWHNCLFPTGRSGIYKINIGQWRTDDTGPMQVVSGGFGKEKVHFQAPDAIHLEKEMNHFLDWFANEKTLDPLLKAGIAHLWFITLHPFDDGNGRIARAITDMQLCKADGSSKRFYSMSAQILLQRNEYYTILEQTQKGSLDITNWLFWFFENVLAALNATNTTLEHVVLKANFWEKLYNTPLNERQKLLLNKMLDGFEGKLTSTKWAKIAKCSPDTALRDIQDLILKGIVMKEDKGGRSTSYTVIL
ncbi:Fic family protein [Flavobacterium restrictum]|uniref:Fic family protein n=1 Tax=Flavobacterium restrictum TaxID=2594428 RepID=A0A553EDQ0_9FLAO|nr:Fic family protein [Flavobacterium restrictum]TRX43160.1 Fic family protein [Flavobacterium restrictum]